jgi:hypothetical protein
MIDAVAAHVPVLLAEAVAALAIDPDGVYVDGTFGRGGHSRALLAALGPTGRLVALDRDPEAAAAAAGVRDPRFSFRRAWFSELPDVLAELSTSASRRPRSTTRRAASRFVPTARWTCGWIPRAASRLPRFSRVPTHAN